MLTVLDELEGVLLSAQKTSIATGRDVLIATQGTWSAGNPLLLAYGDATLGSAPILANGQTAPESFRVAVSAGGGLQRDHLHGGVVATGSTWWASAGTGNATSDISALPPFDGSVPGFSGLLADGTQNLFQGASVNTARISGTSKRFVTTFWIQVVGLRDGNAIVGGPMGLLVVQSNGASIYKFYNPGVRNGGDGKWKRI